MTPEDIVRVKYPEAKAERTSAQYQWGQIDPTQPERWSIFSGPPHLGQQPLGEGPTEKAAWADAARKMK
jgi:hypothetical protein